MNECSVYTYKHFEKIETNFGEGIHAVVSELQGKWSRTDKMARIVARVMAKRHMGIVFCDRVEFVEELVKHINRVGVYAEAYT